MKSLVLVFSLFLSVSTFADVVPIQEIFEPNSANFPSKQYGKVAAVAWVGGTAPLTNDKEKAENFKQQNRSQLEVYIREAAAHGAKLIITPEFGVVGYPDIPELSSEEDNFQTPEQIAPYAEPVPGTSSNFFAALAKKLDVYIQFGMAEDGQDGYFYNTAVVVDPKGTVVAKYRKIHLYDKETDFLKPGDAPVTYDSPFGKIGIIICSDVYASHPMDTYRDLHVDVLALSTSWAQFNTGWTFFKSGAARVGAYLIAANQTYFPDSGVINPDGSDQSHIRQSSGVVYGYLPWVIASVPAKRTTSGQNSCCRSLVRVSN